MEALVRKIFIVNNSDLYFEKINSDFQNIQSQKEISIS